MKKLSKDDILTRDDLKEKLENECQNMVQRKQNVDDAIEALNSAIGSYNDVLTDVENWRDAIVGYMDDYIGERSDKWGETDAANNYESWRSEYENFDITEVDKIDDIDFTLPSHSDDLDKLPEQPES